MILLIDVGNSAIKWAMADDQLLPTRSHPYTLTNLSNVCAEAWAGLSKPKAIFIACVAAKSVAAQLNHYFQKLWPDVPQHFIRATASALGVTNAYNQAELLGIDRWLNVLAAHQQCPHETCCIFDCGTALTVDVVTPAGQHLGGLIFPGMTLLEKSLQENTAGCAIKLDPTPIQPTLLAKNTQDAIKQGSFWGTLAFIQMYAQQLSSELATDSRFILTGGHAQYFLEYLPKNYHYAPHLALQGLKLIADLALK